MRTLGENIVPNERYCKQRERKFHLKRRENRMNKEARLLMNFSERHRSKIRRYLRFSLQHISVRASDRSQSVKPACYLPISVLRVCFEQVIVSTRRRD